MHADRNSFPTTPMVERDLTLPGIAQFVIIEPVGCCTSWLRFLPDAYQYVFSRGVQHPLQVRSSTSVEFCLLAPDTSSLITFSTFTAKKKTLDASLESQTYSLKKSRGTSWSIRECLGLTGNGKHHSAVCDSEVFSV